jgi:hypothetical protein
LSVAEAPGNCASVALPLAVPSKENDFATFSFFSRQERHPDLR